MTRADGLDPEREIFDVVSRYLGDEVGLRELYAWMVDHAEWVVAASGTEASDLANLVEFHLSEMSVFRSGEDDLCRDLRAFVAARAAAASRGRKP